jgi:hypothetical protein
MMFNVLQCLTVILVAVAIALALAHTLELPGKMRLDKETYYAVQAIYYPGFTSSSGTRESRTGTKNRDVRQCLIRHFEWIRVNCC